MIGVLLYLWHEGSISKLHWAESNQRLQELAVDIQGPHAQLYQAQDEDNGANGEDGAYWQYGFIRSKANTIEGGTSEILRNIIAERVLEMPRGR